jgi:glutamate-5-semialdehyde dehydrogenase
MKTQLNELGSQARTAARKLNSITTEEKNRALLKMADAIEENSRSIIEANEKDMQSAKEQGVAPPLQDRLLLNDKRIKEMADSLRDIARLSDPVGEVVSEKTLPNNLRLKKVRVPLGVIGVIFEARPNVTVEAAGLCMKAGNAIILRGGSLAQHSNNILTDIMQKAATSANIPLHAIQIIRDPSREIADAFMALKDLDVLIPRGGKQLIDAIVDNAKVPVLWAAAGNCHTYIDKDANLEKALPIVINAKVQRPGVCNAMETLLLHKDVAAEFLPKVISELQSKGVEIRGDSKTKAFVPSVKEASDEDFYTEFLDLILAVRVVESLEEAIDHIEKYGTRHSEAIISENKDSIDKFLREVDSAAVYANASTRFTDGGQFGLGAEIGISTQKLHVRGPMGLESLTSEKYTIIGDGQIRN